MGPVGSRLLARHEERERRELEAFAERHTTGSLTPHLQSDEEEEEDEEEAEEVDRSYAVEQNVDPLFFRFPNGVGRPGRRLRRLRASNSEASAESSDAEDNAYVLGLRSGQDDDIGPPSPARWEQPEEAPAVQEMMDAPRGRASLVLANDSTYSVSYSVLRADNTTTSQRSKKTTVGVFKNTAKLLTRVAGRKTAVGRLLASMKTEEEVEEDITTDMEDGDMGNFLMRNHRMAPMSETLPTEVLFPADCEELRVRAYARSLCSYEDRGGWKQYTNKVYSIAGKRNRAKERVFTIVASDSAISGWAKKRSHDVVEFRALSLGRRYGTEGSSDDSSDDSSDGCDETHGPLSCRLANPWTARPCPWSPGSNSARGYQSES